NSHYCLLQPVPIKSGKAACAGVANGKILSVEGLRSSLIARRSGSAASQPSGLPRRERALRYQSHVAQQCQRLHSNLVLWVSELGLKLRAVRRMNFARAFRLSHLRGRTRNRGAAARRAGFGGAMTRTTRWL